MGCANYNTLLKGAICFILILCCVPLQSVSGSEPLETVHPEREVSDEVRVAKIAYRIDTSAVTSTTEQLNILRNQTAVRVGDRLSRYAIQQSIKTLYATQRYSQIQVYAQEILDGVALTYQLFPFERIEEIVIIGVLDSEFSNTIRNVLKSKAGGTYIPKVINTDIDRIKRICEEHGYFDARVTVSDMVTGAEETREPEKQHAPSVRLTYQIILGDASTISELRFQGNSAISTSRLNAVCSFSREYPVYNKSAVETDVEFMIALYQENSYPTADILPLFFRETGVLQFEIGEGMQVRFNFVSDVGEVPLLLQDAFREDIISLINTASTTIWERRIKSYFKAAGYHDTTVDEKVVDASEIQLTINPGMRYIVSDVTFAGNLAFSDNALLREMKMKPIRGFLQNLQVGFARIVLQRDSRRFFYEQELDTDVHRLEILYGRAGYPQAAIKATLDKKPSKSRTIGEIVVHLTIVEEHKEMIQRCDIRGNRALDTAILLKRLQSELPLPQPSLRRQTYQDAILKAYYEIGYIDAVVDDAYISETETPVFRVAGDFSASLTKGRLPPEIRDVFGRYDRALEGVFIATNIGNRWSLQDIEGNPRYTLIQGTTHLEVFEHGILRLTVVTEGERVAFGKFYFSGDTDVVKRHVLEREVAHLEGTLWTSEKLSRARQSLYSLGVFHGVQVERLRIEQRMGGNATRRAAEENSSHPGTVTGGEPSLKTDSVLIQVEKQEPRTYSISSGYSRAEGPRLTGELTDSNFLFKQNIRGRLRGRIGWRDELRYLLDATVTEPWLIGRTRGSLQLSARKLEIDDNVRALQGSFILSRRLSKSHYVDLRYSYRDLNQPVPASVQDGLTEFPLLEEQDPFRTTVSSLRFSWTYDSRVRYLNPTGGMFNAITVEYAGGFLRGETGFIKTTTDTRYYQKLVGPFRVTGGNPGLVLATALRLGVTSGLHSNRRAELISFERFWAGGGTTVRGYAERSLGPADSRGIHRGDVQFIFNTELRFPIYSVVRGALFFDTGNLWGSLEDIDTAVRLPSSVGAGVYLDLGAFTGGVDYAIPLVSVPTAETNSIHLRLGSTF